jgi:lipoate-protein ligase A
LHIDELTYSVALPADHPVAAGGVLESYRRISGVLVAGLRLLGISPEADRQLEERAPSNGPVCFETPSHYEITADGRKLIGSAQVRRKGGVLQHGSLPLCGDLGRICDALAYPTDAERQQAKAHVCRRALTLAEASGGKVFSWDSAAKAMVRGFEAALDIEFFGGQLTTAEAQQAERLAAEVYGQVDWTQRR